MSATPDHGLDTDDEDMEWEEVDMPAADGLATLGSAVTDRTTNDNGFTGTAQGGRSIEITLKRAKGKGKEGQKEAASQKAKQAQATRLSRIRCHKIHTVTLLANAAIRNQWINDQLLQARLLSIPPFHLQQSLSSPPSKRVVPSSAQRGRMFEQAINRLVDWWANEWFQVDDLGVRRWSYAEVRRVLEQYPPSFVQDRKKGQEKGNGQVSSISRTGLSGIDQPAIELPEEVIDLFATEPPLASGPKSLAKHLLMRRGSRDVSAQLFTGLCRALGVPARLVVSLQSVGWWGDKPKATKKRKGDTRDGKAKGKGDADGEADDDEDEEMDMEEVDIPTGTTNSNSGTSTASRHSKGKGKEREVFDGEGQRLDGGYIPPTTGNGKAKAKPVIKLRKSKAGGRRLNESPPPEPSSSKLLLSADPDPLTSPPVFWTEVFSRADGVWIPVDPVRGLVNQRRKFDPEYAPGGDKKGKARRTEANRMVYVVGFEEDGFARDVTPRYATDFLSRVSLIQGAATTSSTAASGSSAADRRKWWERIMGMVKRPYVLNRDEVEDEGFREVLRREGMPSSMAGFKGHEVFVLERHLKQTETIYPLEEIGRFRGEPVYPRSNVVQLKTAENWMRNGRAVKAGEQPLKTIKMRASTINRRRELEVFGGGRADNGKGKEREGIGEGLEIDLDGDLPGQRTEGDEGIMQGLYAEFQTEVYKPPPVVNGKIPKNDFGNIDLYVPSMLPEGAVHVPFKGAAKIARTLGFDYAEAVTGFEFRKRRATPIITGVVIAAEHEAALLEAYWEMERDAEEKRKAKRHDQALKRWTRLIQGLKIRERLKKQYANRGAGSNTATTESDEKVREGDIDNGEEQEREAFVEPGGYLTAVDDIVQPFTLPKYQHLADLVAKSRPNGSGAVEQDGDIETAASDDIPPMIMEVIGDDGDASEDMEEIPVSAPVLSGVPKTMRELAEESARKTSVSLEPDASMAEKLPTTVPSPAPAPVNSAEQRATRSSRGNSTRNTPSTTTERKSGVGRRNNRRKRARGELSDSDLGEDQLENAQSEESSPVKKVRGRPNTASPVKSDRVLRVRKSKTAAEVEEERDRELAYRRAVAE
ncbi:Rad4-domain-containing protein [Gloeophyllum trabeum ATCC 11539]|uniref:Rad4-domain-containing protein n=1 Tax=Gloeophyllum trabeum (strain ATCC 11539 / FP-39264 / Madison 617) TaxID=670483 RepID=S7RF50_GLOTA|nr:Rad4-domain-containing protein [Gloeophyllum trabeum ATCC 11539]EPQ51119.1 Rad4-domain-containing protein [Gloeophyllum trabeum ATCC 11539]